MISFLSCVLSGSPFHTSITDTFIRFGKSVESQDVFLLLPVGPTVKTHILISLKLCVFVFVCVFFLDGYVCVYLCFVRVCCQILISNIHHHRGLKYLTILALSALLFALMH